MLKEHMSTLNMVCIKKFTGQFVRNFCPIKKEKKKKKSNLILQPPKFN
jgi:hypothetical protein